MNGREMPLAQLWTATLAMLGVRAFQTAPRAVAAITSTAAPLAMAAAGLVTFLLLWPVAAALSRRPGKGLADLALAGGGRPLAVFLALALGATLVGGAGLNLRQISEMAVTALYPHTPQTFAMSTLTAVSALGAAISPAGLVWIGSLYLWPLAVSVTLVLVGNLGWGQLRHLLPPTGPGLLPVAAEVLTLTSHNGEVLFLAVFSGYLISPRRLVRATAGTVALAAVSGAAVLVVYLMVFPLPGGLSLPFPLFEMTRLVHGGRFLERLDTIWVLFLTFGTASLNASVLQAAAVLFRDAFRLPDHRGAVMPLALAMLAVALFPANQADAIAVETFVIRRWGFLPTLVLPLVVALLAMRRGGAPRG